MKLIDGAFARPVTLTSSAIAQVAYDDHRQLLHVEFRDGSAYSYRDIPPDVYDGLLRARSQGAYFNKIIRGVSAHSALEPLG